MKDTIVYQLVIKLKVSQWIFLLGVILLTFSAMYNHSTSGIYGLIVLSTATLYKKLEHIFDKLDNVSLKDHDPTYGKSVLEQFIEAGIIPTEWKHPNPNKFENWKSEVPDSEKKSYSDQELISQR